MQCSTTALHAACSLPGFQQKTGSGRRLRTRQELLRRKLTTLSFVTHWRPFKLPESRMSVAADRLSQHASLRTQPFLAADVGGTHARVALMRAASGRGREFEMLAYRKFACADFAGLPELLRAF
ncbi:MAG TPA: glucokinase, partial [Rhodanobacteraceae bacterium]|nr:glucokinase [Rhodanobacteraceae bacterium]